MTFDYKSYILDAVLAYAFNSAMYVSDFGGTVWHGAMYLEVSRKAVNAINSASDISNNPHYSDLQKEALIAMGVVEQFGMPFYGTSAQATFEMYWNVIYNVPPVFGGGTREDFFAKLAEEHPFMWKLAGDGTLLKPEWIDHLDTTPVPPLAWAENSLLIDDRDVSDLAQQIADAKGNADSKQSPLALDIAGTGLSFTSRDSSDAAYWDLNADGFREQSGWIGSGTGLLAIDLNDNGIIDDNAELFGNQTGGPANGFQALAAYDTNSDGVIDASDTQFGDLRVWLDTDGDGFSQPDELHTLASLNITNINLAYTNVSYNIAGNNVRQESTFTINGQNHVIADVWFSYNQMNTFYNLDYDLNWDTLFLPMQRGYGLLPDLQVSMSLNGDLLDMVAELAEKSAADLFAPGFDLKAAITEIMFEWAGVSDLSPTSRGPHFDAQKLGFIEKFTGAPLWNIVDSTPGAIVAGSLREAWNLSFSLVATNLLAQAGFTDLLGRPTYDVFTDKLIGGTFGEDLVLRFVSPFAGFNGSIHGSDLNDMYVIGPGDAPVSLSLKIVEAIDKGNDAVLLGGVQENDVYFWTESNGDFVVRFGASDQLKILGTNDAQGGARPGAYIEQIMLDDGTTWDLTAGLYLRNNDTGRALFGSSLGDTIVGGSGNDTIHAKYGDDTIVGGGGNDLMYGNHGDDLYILGSGFSSTGGFDKIEEMTGQGSDTIWFTDGVLAEDLYIWTDSSGYVWMQHQNDPTNNTLRVKGSYTSVTGIESHVEQVIFDDATVWDMTNGLYLRNNDTGRTIMGSAYGDTIIGGAGNDTIHANAGDDTLVGGAGNNLLYGGLDDDLYIFGAAFVSSGGMSTVAELTGQGTDTVWFTDGVLAEDLYIWTDSNGYFWIQNQNDTSGSTVRLSGAKTSGVVVSHVEQVIFDDTTVWDMTDGLYLRNNNTGREFSGSANDDTMIGGTGHDTLRAADGNDTLIGGGGSDLLYGGLGADTFGFTLDSVGNGSSSIGDFSAAQGDRFDLRDVLSGYDPLADALSDFVRFTNTGANAKLEVDLDGAGTVHGWTQIAYIYDYTNLDPATMEADGLLLAA